MAAAFRAGRRLANRQVSGPPPRSCTSPRPGYARSMTDMTINCHPADEKAIDDVLAVRPLWSHMANAATVTGIDHRTLLHAGPAFDEPRAVSRPILNS